MEKKSEDRKDKHEIFSKLLDLEGLSKTLFLIHKPSLKNIFKKSQRHQGDQKHFLESSSFRGPTRALAEIPKHFYNKKNVLKTFFSLPEDIFFLNHESLRTPKKYFQKFPDLEGLAKIPITPKTIYFWNLGALEGSTKISLKI